MTYRLIVVAASIGVLAGIFAGPAPQAGAPAAKGPAAKGNAKAGGYKPPEGPAPKTPWGKPDLNGVWQRPYVSDIERGNGGPLPYTEWGKKQWESYNPEEGRLYRRACLPFGHVRAINSPDPIEIMQTPTKFAYLYEQNSWFKVFPIDGTQPKPKVPTWFGDSVGHWEGDTLVIVTTNFNGLTRLDTVWPSAQRSVEAYRASHAHRRRTPRLPDHHRRSEDVHQADRQRPDVHASHRLGDPRIFLRRKQCRPGRRPDQSSRCK